MTSKDYEYLENNVKSRKVTLVDFSFTQVRIKNITGFCHCQLHKGYLTANLMKSHDCIEKECVFFEKFENYPYWANIAREKKVENRKKMEKQLEKETEKQRERQHQEQLLSMRDEAQKIANSLGFSIIVTRVAHSVSGKQSEYVINYVSSSPFNDWSDYFELVIQFSKVFSGRYILRKLKMPDGRYATIEDWEKKKKEK